MEKIFPVLGYDIGGTKIAVSLADSNGKILGSARLDNKDTNPDEVLPQLVSEAKKMMSEAGIKQEDLRAIGIDAPAPMDIEKGLILNPPNNPTWINVPIRDYLADAFKTEAFLENDANAGALAEWMFGAGKGAKDMIYLTMSTGIGGGIIANGHLLHGRGLIAGELGHTVIDVEGPVCNCGMKGCYEAFCGGRAVAQRLQRELADQPNHPIVKHAGGKVEDIDYLAFENAVRDGNGYAMGLWEEIAKRNAQAIGMFINIFNPEKIVLGTIAKAAGDLFMDPLVQHLPLYCWKQNLDVCEVVPCELGRDIGNYAGVCTALNCLYECGDFDLPK
jgi:glucokinase